MANPEWAARAMGFYEPGARNLVREGQLSVGMETRIVLALDQELLMRLLQLEADGGEVARRLMAAATTAINTLAGQLLLEHGLGQLMRPGEAARLGRMLTERPIETIYDARAVLRSAWPKAQHNRDRRLVEADDLSSEACRALTVAQPAPPAEADPAQAVLIGEISARVEAAHASGRRVNVVELGRRERAILRYDGIRVAVDEEGTEIALQLRPVEAQEALSVFYDPAV